VSGSQKDGATAPEYHRNRTSNRVRSLKAAHSVYRVLSGILSSTMQTIREFARTVRQGIQLAANNFEAKRKIIDLLPVQVTIVVEIKKR
jgi:hypothetical protein